VEDFKLWSIFAAKRAEMRKRAQQAPFECDPPTTTSLLEFSAQKTIDERVNEFWLFHGTSEEAARGIAQSNFRLPTHAGNFGKGAYFAEDAAKSDGYSRFVSTSTSDADKAGCKIMMLCRVLLGNQHNLIKLNGNKSDTTAERHCVDPNVDSVLGAVGAREFLVSRVLSVVRPSDLPALSALIQVFLSGHYCCTGLRCFPDLPRVSSLCTAIHIYLSYSCISEMCDRLAVLRYIMYYKPAGQ
jgi:hypothetical protein